MQAVHDGVNVFFMLQVDGAYAYSKGYFRHLLCYICTSADTMIVEAAVPFSFSSETLYWIGDVLYSQLAILFCSH